MVLSIPIWADCLKGFDESETLLLQTAELLRSWFDEQVNIKSAGRPGHSDQQALYRKHGRDVVTSGRGWQPYRRALMVALLNLQHTLDASGEAVVNT